MPVVRSKTVKARPKTTSAESEDDQEYRPKYKPAPPLKKRSTTSGPSRALKPVVELIKNPPRTRKLATRPVLEKERSGPRTKATDKARDNAKPESQNRDEQDELHTMAVALLLGRSYQRWHALIDRLRVVHRLHPSWTTIPNQVIDELIAMVTMVIDSEEERLRLSEITVVPL